MVGIGRTKIELLGFMVCTNLRLKCQRQLGQWIRCDSSYDIGCGV